MSHPPTQPPHRPLPAVEIPVEIAADHPAFAGHFPGAPVLPGAVLLSLVIEALPPALHSGLGDVPQIEQVKFLAPVGPGQRLQIRFEPQAGGVAFELRCGTVAMARGRLSAATPT